MAYGIYLLVNRLADNLFKLLNGNFATFCQICHFMMVINSVRESWDIKNVKQHPLLTWLLSMTCCFGGGVAVNLLVGNQPLAVFENNDAVLQACVIWFLIFYTPRNLFTRTLNKISIFGVVLLCKEILRAKKVQKGVTIGHKAYSASLLNPIILGVVASCGGGFIKNSSNLFTSLWTTDSIKSYSSSFITKTCILTSFFHSFILNNVFDHISHNLIGLFQVSLIYSVAMMKKMDINFKPFVAIDNFFISIFIESPEKLIETFTTKFLSKQSDSDNQSSKLSSKKERSKRSKVIEKHDIESDSEASTYSSSSN